MHSELKHPVPAVAAIIVRDGHILMIKRGVEPSLGKWSVPGGRLEIGETMEEGLRREVLEETGLDVEVGTLAGVSDLIVKKDDELWFHYVVLDFFAQVRSGEAVAASDVVDCRWIRLDELDHYDVTLSLLGTLRKNGLIP